MLIYIGNGDAAIGIPARDLTDEEVEEHGGELILLATGLYVKPVAKPAGKKPADKSGQEE